MKTIISFLEQHQVLNCNKQGGNQFVKKNITAKIWKVLTEPSRCKKKFFWLPLVLEI